MSNQARRLLALVVVAAGVIAYHNGFDGVFLYDDSNWIVHNDELRVLWPPSVAMGASYRVLAFYSFAVNYAISGLAPWSYHALTLTLHILAACTVFALLGRALQLPRVGLEARRADLVALTVAVLWVVHPLNTQAVMYVVQRAEVMMGLAYVLMLYAFVRYVGAEHGAGRRAWLAATFATYTIGLGSKEVMATAPVTIYMFDALLVTGSLLKPLRRRWRVYAACVAPLVLAPVVFFAVDPDRLAVLRPNAAAPAALDYVAAQGAVIAAYLRSVVWPVGLNFDHAWMPADHADALIPGAIFVSVLVLATAEAVRRRAPIGFVGAAFFIVLAPTSSVFPLHDYMVEHRMYLPSIAVILVVVLGIGAVLRRIALPTARATALTGGAVVVVAASLTALTVRRNAACDSRVGMWADVVAKSPGNARGHYNLGLALMVSADGMIPLFSEIYPGNQPDSVTFESVTEALVSRYRALAGENSDITLVFDKRNLAALSESPYHVIGSLVPSQHKDLLSIPPRRFSASKDARLAGVTTYRTKKLVHGTEWTVVVTRSQSLLEGQLRGIAQRIAKRKKRFLKLRKKLRASQRPGANKGGGYTRESLLAHAEELSEGQYVKHILDVEVRGEGGDGEKLSIFFRQKRGALDRLVRDVLGKRIVFSDNHEWSTDEIVLGYRSQHHVEAAFRQMKDRFHVSFEPVRHWTDQQIRVHAFVCVLALTLASVLRREMARAGTELTVDALLEELQGIQEVVNLYPAAGGGAGRPRAQRVLTRMSPLQAQLFESLDLGRFHRP